MPFEDFSIGKDVTLNVNTPTGPLPLPVTVTSFDAKPEYNTIKSQPLNGSNREVKVPIGWRITITVDRIDNSLDSFFANKEASYYAGVNVLRVNIVETIQERTGTPSQYLYAGVDINFMDTGKKTGDNKIEQTIEAFASRRIELS